MPGGVAGERPVKAVPYADAWNLPGVMAVWVGGKPMWPTAVSFFNRINRLFAASL